eukprot:1613163-Prymnesium_polylepis.2
MRARTAANAVAAVLARYPRRDQLDGARSKAAKQHRRASLKPKQQQRRAEGEAGDAAVGAAVQRQAAQEAALREAALRSALSQAERRVKAERNRSKRDMKTAVLRAKQADQSNGKAAQRKRQQKRKLESWRAERKDDER